MFKIVFAADLSASQMLLPYFSICQESRRYIYLVQVYDLRGCDVCIWYQRPNNNYCHLVIGTGPILLDMSAIRAHVDSFAGENGNDWLTNIRKSDLTTAIHNNAESQAFR